MEIKSFIFILIFTLAGIGANAQKKNIVEANLYYDLPIQTTSLPKPPNFGLSVDYYYKLNKVFYIGAQARIDYFYYDSEDKQIVYNFGPAFMFSINITDRFRYIPQIFGIISYGENLIYDYRLKFYQFGYGIKPLAFDYRINDLIALSFGFGGFEYTYYHSPGTEYDRYRFDHRLKTDIFLGIRFMF